MAKYIRKSFSAHIYQDWIHLFKQCSTEQRSELLLAITDYPNYEPTMDIAIWDFIKSQLDVQYQKTENKSQTMSDNRNKSRPKSTEVDQSQPMSTEVDKCSQIEIKKETEIENKEKELSDDNSKKKPIDFDTTFEVGGQFFELLPEFRKLALTRYTEEEIHEFEKEHSCHENLVKVCLNDIKKQEQPKPKKKQVEVVNYGEYEYLHSQMDKWIDYKKSRGERYKTEQSLMVCAKKLHELSGGSASVADQIIEQSMANNWAGIFELKQTTQYSPRMSFKEMKESENHIKLQKMLNGEL